MKKLRILAVLAAAAMLLTGCMSAPPIPDEVWLGIMESEIIRRDGKLPASMPVLEAETEADTETETEPETEPPETEAPTEATEPPEAAPTDSSAEGAPLVAENADDVYAIYCRGLEQYQNHIVVFGHGLDGDMLEAAYDRVVQERPDLFWVRGYSTTYSEIRAEVSFTVVQDLSSEQLSGMHDEMMRTAQAICAEAQHYTTDYDRILYVHDYIVEHTEYDHDGSAAIGNGEAAGLYSTAYGCLVQGSAVCEGYSQAFHLLMQMMDIPCGVCSGIADGESHAWNWVQADGEYYWVDVTWDDPTTGDAGGSLDHSYCLISDEMLYRTRTVDEDVFIPQCTSLKDNYYVHTGNYLTGYDFAEIDSRLSAAADGTIDVMFADAYSYTAALDDLFTAERIWDAAVFAGAGGRYVYSHNDEMYTLQIEIYPN